MHATLKKFWRLVVGLWPAAITLGVVWLAFVVVGNPLGKPATLGRIIVDTPEIYTRERLVNDRLIHEAWLLEQLKKTSEVQGSLSSRTDSRTLDLQAAGANPQAKPPDEAASESAAPTPNGKEETKAQELARLSDRAKLMEAVDFREMVRNLTIENQLDDRHDLNGNSLYKMKFDASVLPGQNTQASAQILVTVSGPGFVNAEPDPSLGSLGELGKQQDVDAWRALYVRWIESLQSRLNQTQRELKLIYHNSEMSHNDYAHLIDYVSRSLLVRPTRALGCDESIRIVRSEAVLPLQGEAHAARKSCVQAIIESSLPGEVAVYDKSAPPPGTADPTLGEYVSGKTTSSLRPRKLTDQERSIQSSRALDFWLNSFFAGKTLRLVLGVAIPEERFRTQLYNVAALQKLAKLTFFNTSYGSLDLRSSAGDPDVFHVAPRTIEVIGVDSGVVTGATFDSLAAKGYFGVAKLSQFIELEPAFRYLLPNTISREEVALRRADFKRVERVEGAGEVPGVYRAQVEPGLVAFARIGRLHNKAFTYAATPKESAETINSTILLDSRLDAKGLPLGRTAAALLAQRQFLSNALERRSVVIGFSGGSDKETARQFGWLIAPRQVAADGQALAYVQAPAQYSLSALVSIPAWWNEVSLVVTTRWVGQDGASVVREQTWRQDHIELPTDFEPLESLLLGIEQIGPALMDTRLDPVLLTACRPGSIQIPGRRLWRSTKVTLGYQLADSILVLPNMKGIVATFGRVANQMSVAEEHAMKANGGGPRQIERHVRVWTSQGSLTFPTRASIGIPEGCGPEGT